VADRPLRPATRRCLGRPLPHQLADRPRAPPEAKKHFFIRPCDQMKVSSISTGFPVLSQSSGQVAHVLLTRSPLNLQKYCYLLDSVRLACIKHAASVHSEPGSNSPSSIQNHRSGKEFRRADWNALLPIDLTTPPRGGVDESPTACFDVRRDQIELIIAVRTGFWLSFFRFQGATTHTPDGGGVKFTRTRDFSRVH
jgi:hypothetical protein